MQVHSHKTAAMQAHLHKPLHHLLKGVLRLNESLDSADSSSSAGKDLVIQVAILRVCTHKGSGDSAKTVSYRLLSCEACTHKDSVGQN